MIVEVNDAGEILVPAELVQAAPHTLLKADREGDSVVLTPLTEKPRDKGRPLADWLPKLEGRLSDPAMTFRREEMYGPTPGSSPMRHLINSDAEALRMEIRNSLPCGQDWLLSPHQLLGGDSPEDRILAGDLEAVNTLLRSVLYIGVA